MSCCIPNIEWEGFVLTSHDWFFFQLLSYLSNPDATTRREALKTLNE